VGGRGDDVDTDLPLARDGRGRYYVPGTSLTGALREWCRDMWNKEFVEATWGFQEGAEGRASAVVVENAVIAEDAAAELRDGVGIDRIWGCAAEHVKYDRAVLPRGTKIPLVLTVELADRADDTREMFGDLLAALGRGEVRFGAARTRGLGRLELAAGCRIMEETLDTREGILAVLAGTAPVVTLPSSGRARPCLEVEIAWRPRGPLMVKSGVDGLGVDMLPLVSACNGSLAPVLPGSSVKGCFRAQAERIVRTLLDLRADPKLERKKRFLRHLRVPLVEQLFGSPGRSRSEAKAGLYERELDLGLGALVVDDCYAESIRIPPERWDRVTRATPDAEVGKSHSALRTELDQPGLGLAQWTAGYHVAVDRWTGGAADGFLYTVLEPHGVAWEPLRLRIDPGRLKRFDYQHEGLALLLLVLRDLVGGRVPLGFATHRGMGAVEITSIVFRATNCEEPLSQLHGIELAAGDIAGLPQALITKLDGRWQTWLKGQLGAHS
jgi:CRISPR/Cas system CSM-associated protein Csm3 (group 7 of RAMP superfamily)